MSSDAIVFLNQILFCERNCFFVGFTLDNGAMHLWQVPFENTFVQLTSTKKISILQSSTNYDSFLIFEEQRVSVMLTLNVLLLQLFLSCLSLFSEKLKSRYCEEGVNEKSDAKSRKDQISQKPLLLETQYCLLRLHFLLNFNIELLISANTQGPLVHGKNTLELSLNVQTTKISSKEHVQLLKHCINTATWILSQLLWR